MRGSGLRMSTVADTTHASMSGLRLTRLAVAFCMSLSRLVMAATFHPHVRMSWGCCLAWAFIGAKPLSVSRWYSARSSWMGFGRPVLAVMV